MFDGAELQRRRERLKAARQYVKEAEEDTSQTQLNSATERTQFFEKLAIGSGAAVAAIVSYLDTHAHGLNPHWTMRTALVLLTISMVSALYRNFRYPYYVLAVKDLNWIEAKVHELQCKKECFEAEPNPFSWQTGERIDAAAWIASADAKEIKIKDVLKNKDRRRRRLLREFLCAEAVCLVALSLAMIALVWLALSNF